MQGDESKEECNEQTTITNLKEKDPSVGKEREGIKEKAGVLSQAVRAT